MHNVKDWRMWALAIGVIGAIAGLMAAGYFIGQWGMSAERSEWQAERKVFIDRFPVARAEERASCTKEYESKLTGLRELGVERDKREAAQTQAMDDLKAQMADMHELTAYTLRFMGDRAKVADRNAATQLKETRVAVAAAVDAKQKTEQVGAKVEVAVAKADEAASAVKSVDKKLETAVRPTAAVPSHVWGK